jgi:ABC-2 type transport system permease protein
MKYFTLAAKTAQIYLNKELAYKTNFIIMMCGMVINDLIGPMLALIIYGTTVGIPGWTFDQFLLFQGTLILVYGIGRALTGDFFWKAFEAINRGEFDKYLLKPYNSWLYLMAMGIDWNGFFEAVLGVIIISYTMTKLHISALSTGFAMYLVLICAGILFQFAVITLITAGSFIAVKNESLVILYMKLADFARYPLTVYGVGLQFALTFLFPVAISAFYPVEALLRGMTVFGLAVVITPVIVLFILALWAWHSTIRKYTSAGG